MPQKLEEFRSRLLVCRLNYENEIDPFQSLISEIEDQITNQPFDEELIELHIEALYFAPSHLPNRKPRLIDYAEKYLSQSPQNFWIRYHLANLLFDEGEYAKSLYEFYSLPNPELFLLSIDQKWRLVKLNEIYACIFLRLGKFEEANRHLTNLLATLAFMEPVEIPIHTELFNTLNFLKENPTPTLPLDQIQYWESKFDFSKLKT